MRHSTIQFGKNTVTKTAAPDLMLVEVEKTRRAYAIGRDCGLFRVPKILDYDEAKGVAVFERLRGIDPFRNVVSGLRKHKDVIEQTGRALAVIHRELTLPHEMTIDLPSEFDLPENRVFLHGDFNGINVCLTSGQPSIVILDWQMTSRHGGRATYGSRYFDLLWFVNYMIWTPRISYIFCDPVAPVAKVFIESYFKEAGVSWDKDIFLLYAKRFFETKLPLRKEHASWRYRWLLHRSCVLTHLFIESLKMLDLDEQKPSFSGAICGDKRP